MKTVQLESGKKYLCSEIYSKKGENFIVEDFITFKPEEGKLNPFNRFTIKYYSSEPLKMVINYVQNERNENRYYFLEAGENTFNGLTYDYLKGIKANEVQEIKFIVLTDKTAELCLKDITFTDYPVYNDVMYYLENERYKLGIRLIWGGGISFVQDKNCKIEGLTNLVNSFDVGRLIQQSYYGQGDSKEYTAGYFIGSKWCYNPVQGGDQHENHSRLIDLKVEKDRVYIKSQPQDWSQDGLITPSYMENLYVIDGEKIRVDNRFVDFSGYKHMLCGQEVPAFYTVSYLDTLYYYNGDNPWTDGKLSMEDDLDFWGDTRHCVYSRFLYSEKNDECWSAWVNKENNFGMGLYTPYTGFNFCGRASYNGSMRTDENPTNYTAPESLVHIHSYTPIEYSYLIACGSVEEIRNVFKKNKYFAENKSLQEHYLDFRYKSDTDYTNIDFSLEKNKDNYFKIYSKSSYDKTEKAIRIDFKNYSESFVVPVRESKNKISSEDVSKLEIEYKVNPDNKSAKSGYKIYIVVGKVRGYHPEKAICGNYICDGKYHKISINLKEYEWFKGNINFLCFDYCNEPYEGDCVYIKSIKFLK